MRHLRLILLVLAGALASSARAAPRSEEERLVDRAVERGLLHLKARQDEEGYWTDRFGHPNPGITSLALLAFLSAGHLPGEGPHGEVVEKGIRWVLEQQQENGLIATDGQTEMYQHGISTLMLAEA